MNKLCFSVGSASGDLGCGGEGRARGGGGFGTCVGGCGGGGGGLGGRLGGGVDLHHRAKGRVERAAALT